MGKSMKTKKKSKKEASAKMPYKPLEEDQLDYARLHNAVENGSAEAEYFLRTQVTFNMVCRVCGEELDNLAELMTHKRKDCRIRMDTTGQDAITEALLGMSEGSQKEALLTLLGKPPTSRNSRDTVAVVQRRADRPPVMRKVPETTRFVNGMQMCPRPKTTDVFKKDTNDQAKAKDISMVVMPKEPVPFDLNEMHLRYRKADLEGREYDEEEYPFMDRMSSHPFVKLLANLTMKKCMHLDCAQEMEFGTLEALSYHITVKHPSKCSVYQCMICGTVFDTHEVLRKHVEERHYITKWKHNDFREAQIANKRKRNRAEPDNRVRRSMSFDDTPKEINPDVTMPSQMKTRSSSRRKSVAPRKVREMESNDDSEGEEDKERKIFSKLNFVPTLIAIHPTVANIVSEEEVPADKDEKKKNGKNDKLSEKTIEDCISKPVLEHSWLLQRRVAKKHRDFDQNAFEKAIDYLLQLNKEPKVEVIGSSTRHSRNALKYGKNNKPTENEKNARKKETAPQNSVEETIEKSECTRMMTIKSRSNTTPIVSSRAAKEAMDTDTGKAESLTVIKEKIDAKASNAKASTFSLNDSRVAKEAIVAETSNASNRIPTTGATTFAISPFSKAPSLGVVLGMTTRSGKTKSIATPLPVPKTKSKENCCEKQSTSNEGNLSSDCSLTAKSTNRKQSIKEKGIEETPKRLSKKKQTVPIDSDITVLAERVTTRSAARRASVGSCQLTLTPEKTRSIRKENCTNVTPTNTKDTQKRALTEPKKNTSARHSVADKPIVERRYKSRRLSGLPPAFIPPKSSSPSFRRRLKKIIKVEIRDDGEEDTVMEMVREVREDEDVRAVLTNIINLLSEAEESDQYPQTRTEERKSHDYNGDSDNGQHNSRKKSSRRTSGAWSALRRTRMKNPLLAFIKAEIQSDEEEYEVDTVLPPVTSNVRSSPLIISEVEEEVEKLVNQLLSQIETAEFPDVSYSSNTMTSHNENFDPNETITTEERTPMLVSDRQKKKKQKTANTLKEAEQLINGDTEKRSDTPTRASGRARKAPVWIDENFITGQSPLKRRKKDENHQTIAATSVSSKHENIHRNEDKPLKPESFMSIVIRDGQPEVVVKRSKRCKSPVPHATPTIVSEDGIHNDIEEPIRKKKKKRSKEERKAERAARRARENDIVLPSEFQMMEGEEDDVLFYTPHARRIMRQVYGADAVESPKPNRRKQNLQNIKDGDDNLEVIECGDRAVRPADLATIPVYLSAHQREQFFSRLETLDLKEAYGKHKCRDCGLVLRSMREGRRHVVGHIRVIRLRCSLCKVGAFFCSDMRNHLMFRHCDRIDQAKTRLPLQKVAPGLPCMDRLDADKMTELVDECQPGHVSYTSGKIISVLSLKPYLPDAQIEERILGTARVPNHPMLEVPEGGDRELIENQGILIPCEDPDDEEEGSTMTVTLEQEEEPNLSDSVNRIVQIRPIQLPPNKACLQSDERDQKPCCSKSLPTEV